jgi:hypothetical protein
MIGVPIKASSIYSKPTLSFLENQFKQNEILRQEHRKYLKLKTSIDWIMVKPPKGLVENFYHWLTHLLRGTGTPHTSPALNPAPGLYARFLFLKLNILRLVVAIKYIVFITLILFLVR